MLPQVEDLVARANDGYLDRVELGLIHDFHFFIYLQLRPFQSHT